MHEQPTEKRSLSRRLVEAEETLAAIRAGEVDAVVVDGPHGKQVYTLESADLPFRNFVEQMQEGALTVNEQGTIVYCNRYFASLVGQPLDRVMGGSLEWFIAPGSRETVRSLLRAVGVGSVHGECLLVVGGGREVPVRLAVAPLPCETSRTRGIVVTDLTERDRAQQLELARRAAEEANIARDRFLAVVSHELRTPLNAVLGWSQMLTRMDGLPQQAEHGLKVIERHARAQKQLIDDLLDVSRVLAGRLRLEVQQVDLRDVIDAALPSVRLAADAKEIDLVTVLDPGVGPVSGDPDRLQQVVRNLLANAVKYTPNGGRVEVRLVRDRRVAKVVVSDNGRGIAPDFLPRVFGLFEQAEGASSLTSGGLGLGLAIVKQITELHGGEAHVHSDGEGRGATFTVSLPLANSARPAQEPDDAPGVPAVPVPTANLQGLRVLIVEDEPDAGELVACLVSGCGGTVRVARTAEEGMAILEHEPIDLLVSDIGLPDIDGYEFIRRVRAGGRNARDLPAIAVTALARPQDRHSALLAGFQTHLSKPVEHDELSAIIASLAGRTGV